MKQWKTVYPTLEDAFYQLVALVEENGWYCLCAFVLGYYIFDTYLRDWIYAKSVNTAPATPEEKLKELNEQRLQALRKTEEQVAKDKEDYMKVMAEKEAKKKEVLKKKYQDVFKEGNVVGSSDDPEGTDTRRMDAWNAQPSSSRRRPHQRPNQGAFNHLSGGDGGGPGYRPSRPSRGG